mgnify:CR=1 FL=1
MFYLYLSHRSIDRLVDVKSADDTKAPSGAFVFHKVFYKSLKVSIFAPILLSRSAKSSYPRLML